MNLHGKFIVFDGPDGSGKGSQLDRLAEWIEGQGVAITRAFDPGGTEVGDRIRHVLLDYDLSKVDPRCETLLFMASRAQLIAEIVRPALAAGHVVLCDRFISATCAYQVAAGVSRDDVLMLGKLAVGDTWPDLTLVLDVPPEVGFERTGRSPHNTRKSGSGKRGPGGGQFEMFNGATPDAIERRSPDFHRRVRALFRELPSVYPVPVVVVDAARGPDEVFADVRQAVTRAFS